MLLKISRKRKKEAKKLAEKFIAKIFFQLLRNGMIKNYKLEKKYSKICKKNKHLN